MTTHTKTLAGLVLSASLVFAIALPAMAQTAASTNIQKSIDSADKEMTNRLDALNKLSVRIVDIKNLTAADKANLSAEIQTQVNTLNAQKAKIDADIDAAALRIDTASITANYRIYALIVPQIEIVAAADRLKTIAVDLSTVAAKLQTRMTDAQSVGNDITALQKSLTDLQAKVTDAQTQAQSAVSAVSTLVPDQGDATKTASNETILKQARAALKTGQSDIQTARQDAGSILKAIRAFRPKGNATSTAAK
jgi:type I site-specific restriction endonuclease